MQAILAWGSNNHYQLAICNQDDQSIPHITAPFDRTHVCNIASIGGGGAHTFIQFVDGSVYLCGWNKDGQTAGSTIFNDVIVPTPVLGISQVKRIACGWTHTLVCTIEGVVFTWGSNTFGQLGTDKIVAYTNKPILLDPSAFNEEAISSIACGMRHSGCVSITGRVYSWGSGNKGQLGREGNHAIPGVLGVEILKDTHIIDLYMGNGHSLLLSENRKIFVCGDNSYGQCGLECALDKPYILKPVKLENVDAVVKIDCGWQHSLLLTEKGEVYSWGRCDYGQLGREVISGKIKEGKGTTDIKRVGLSCKIVDIKCGAQHSIVLSENSQVYVWGWNEHGMCGNGKEENVHRPVLVNIKDKVVRIGCGNGTSFAVIECVL
ncbi:Secretion-regulating guanine nucleotide exchange factor [Oopsacas minuta]|uniref:Secretion-regulating guanine nucleotide exchange factor n=1 Tax=Oopsacas minuta TaxID=111878 RepID=A0AAV7JTJ8_9METZ|nr:Secretion-regulating guanine nucleotide exchange factor [Oopsacas minuta]